MKAWRYHPSPSVSLSVAESLTVFPRERDMTHTLLRVFWNVWLRIFLRVYFHLSIKGRENLPSGKSFVIVANHSSHLDAMCLTAALPMRTLDRVFSVAAKDCFFSSFFRSLFSAVFVNALPFDRHRRHRESLELCADVLKVSEQALIMFPEGTRSLDGGIQAFKPGIGLLVAGTDRVVVPAYIHGAHRAWAKGDRIPRPAPIRLIIGSPMNFAGLERNKENYLRVAQLCEEAVKKLGERENDGRRSRLPWPIHGKGQVFSGQNYTGEGF